MSYPKARATLEQIRFYLKKGTWPAGGPPEILQNTMSPDAEAITTALLEVVEMMLTKQSPAPRKIDIREFRTEGYVQELNRQFLHPLGLALEITQEDNGIEYISGVWDYRDDPEVILLSNPDVGKAKRVAKHAKVRHATRKDKCGFVVQPIASGFETAGDD